MKYIDADKLKEIICKYYNPKLYEHIFKIIDELSEDREDVVRIKGSEFCNEEPNEYMKFTDWAVREGYTTKVPNSIMNLFIHYLESINKHKKEQPNPLKVAIKGDGTEEYGKKIIGYFENLETYTSYISCDVAGFYYYSENGEFKTSETLPEGYIEISLKEEKKESNDDIVPKITVSVESFSKLGSKKEKSLIDNYITQHIENSMKNQLKGIHDEHKDMEKKIENSLEVGKVYRFRSYNNCVIFITHIIDNANLKAYGINVLGNWEENSCWSNVPEFWEEISPDEWLKVLFKEAVRRFPKGSLVKSLNDEEFTVAEKWNKPEKDNWIDGVFYKGNFSLSNPDIYVMGEDTRRGYQIYSKGKWAKCLDEKLQSPQVDKSFEVPLVDNKATIEQLQREKEVLLERLDQLNSSINQNKAIRISIEELYETTLNQNVQLKEDNQTLSKELEEVISDRDDLAKKFIEFKDRENVILEASIKEVENRKKVLINKILDFSNQYKNSISTIQDFKNGVHKACTQIIDLVEKM